SRRRHTRSKRDWSSDVCSSDLELRLEALVVRKADLDRARAVNDVVVRDDVTGLVDDEAGAERALRLRRPERIAEEGIGRLLELRSEERRVGKECRVGRGREPWT